MSTRESYRTLTFWIVPLTAVAIGLAYLVAGLVGDDPGFGATGLLVMVGVGAVLLVAARWSETAQGLLDRKDERIRSIDASATSFAGMSLIAAVLVMFVVEVARGRTGRRTPPSARSPASPTWHRSSGCGSAADGARPATVSQGMQENGHLPVHIRPGK